MAAAFQESSFVPSDPEGLLRRGRLLRHDSPVRRILLAAASVTAALGALSPLFAEKPAAIRLLVRGDDMGSAQAANEAIIRCYRAGVMRSTEIMAPTPWYPQAVRLLRENPGLDVGLHLTLTAEWDDIKWRPLTTAPSLVEGSGYFFPMVSPGPHYGRERALKEQPLDLGEIERELRAQIAAARSAIPTLSHLSSHMGFTSVGPQVRALVERLAVENGLLGEQDLAGVRSVGWGRPCRTPEEKVTRFREIVSELQAGTWLFVDHPAFDTPESRGLGHVGYDDVASDRQGVLDAWTDPEVLAIVKRRGIELVSYADVGGRGQNR
jgi:hypothetical protein